MRRPSWCEALMRRKMIFPSQTKLDFDAFLGSCGRANKRSSPAEKPEELPKRSPEADERIWRWTGWTGH